MQFIPAKTPRMPLPDEGVARLFVQAKYAISTLITIGCLVFLIYGMAGGYAVLPGPPVVHILLFVFVLTMLGYLEGLQVAILATEHKDVDHYEDLYPSGVKLVHLMARGKNVSRFLMGRQFFVIFVVFLCAQITTFPDVPTGSLPYWLKIVLVDTGLGGALVVLCFGQLMPQLVAQCDPLWWMDLPLALAVTRLCLFMEWTGIPHIAWVLSATVMSVFSLPNLPAFRGVKCLVNRKDMELVVDAADLDRSELMKSADEGLSAVATEEIVLNKTVMGWESAMKKWGYGPQGKHVAPVHIAMELAKNNDPIPRFLLPPEHDLHIPPHIVAYELMQRNGKLFSELSLLRQAIGRPIASV